MHRPGFTLLEMILALAIGLVLMISLYSVLNMQVQQAQVGRLKLEEATLARDIRKRMTLNILSHVGPANPAPTPAASSSSSSASSSTSSSYTTTINEAFLFNNGVYGNSGLLVLSTSKVPLAASNGNTRAPVTDTPLDQATVSDLRRISYWISSEGLCVQELDNATSNDMNSFPPDVPPGTYKVLAPEVKDVVFEFWDGTGWQTSWDGTQPAADGVTPMGPPSAIRITLTFFRKTGDDSADEKSTYPFVVAIPAGNNFPSTNQ